MHLSSRHLHTRLTAFASKPAPTGVCVHPVRPALKSRFAVSGLAWKDQNQRRSRDAERLVRHYHAERRTDQTTPRTPCGTGFSREEAVWTPSVFAVFPMTLSRLKPVPLEQPRAVSGTAPPLVGPAGKLSICSKRAFDLHTQKVQPPPIATWVQAERRSCAVGRAAGMRRERRQDMDVRSARAHGARPE